MLTNKHPTGVRCSCIHSEGQTTQTNSILRRQLTSPTLMSLSFNVSSLLSLFLYKLQLTSLSFLSIPALLSFSSCTFQLFRLSSYAFQLFCLSLHIPALLPLLLYIPALLSLVLRSTTLLFPLPKQPKCLTSLHKQAVVLFLF